jgi:intein/homing endonuclease
MKLTKKSMILIYVKSKGEARYTDIIKFIFEFNHPGKIYNHKENRGYYSEAFSGPGDKNYLLRGKKRLIKKPNGKYAYYEDKEKFRIQKESDYLDEPEY